MIFVISSQYLRFLKKLISIIAFQIFAFAFAFDVNASGVSGLASDILYEIEFVQCIEALEVAGERVGSSGAHFSSSSNLYKQSVIDKRGTVAEIIFPGDAKCNGKNIYSSVSGNVLSYVVINGMIFELFGGQPFFTEAKKFNNYFLNSRNFTQIIFQWSNNVRCHAVEVDSFDKNAIDCFNLYYYDYDARQLIRVDLSHSSVGNN